VTAGFIIGLDGDNENCFKAQYDFIQSTGIPSAMVGLLHALKGTDLYRRLEGEGRLLEETSGDNVSIALNFVPRMDAAFLLNGYKHLLSSLYDPTLKSYFERCWTFFKRWNIRPRAHQRLDLSSLRAVLMSLVLQTLSRHGAAYLRCLIRVVFRRPLLLAQFFRFSIMGYHYERITRQQVMIDDFRQLLAAERRTLKEFITHTATLGGSRVIELQNRLYESYALIRARYWEIHGDYRCAVEGALSSFHESIENYLSQLAEPFRPELPGIALIVH